MQYTFNLYQPSISTNPVGEAITRFQRGQIPEALAILTKAIKSAPNNISYLYNYAVMLIQIKQFSAARQSLEQVIKLQPQYTKALNSLAVCCVELGDYKAAQNYYQQALVITPKDPETLFNYGVFCHHRRFMDDAIRSLTQTLQIEPRDAEAEQALAYVYMEKRQYQLAVHHFNKLIKQVPPLAHLIVNVARCEKYMCHWRDYEKRLQQVKDITQQQLARHEEVTLQSFESLSWPLTAACQHQIAQAYSARVERESVEVQAKLNFTYPRTRGKRLKIGYISYDFRRHTVGHLTQRLFAAHDREQVEVVAYSTGRDDQSDERKRIAESVDQFIDLNDMSFLECAQKINQDGIHILVDLTGYTKGLSSRVMALRPAPIAVNYLGFIGSLGANFIDYIITDNIVTPPQAAKDYTEKFVLMPHCHQVNSQQYTLNTPLTRAEYGLPEEAFVYCCFNNNYKFTPELFHVWMQILKQQDNAVLWLLNENEGVVDNLRSYAREQGIDPARLIFADKAPMADHLARHCVADLYLDTLVVSARTSASDALHTGLPLLTCPGDTFASRVAASLLTTLDLPELIAKDLTDYQEKALYYAQYPSALTQLKAKLKSQVMTSPLYDTNLFTQHLEKAYAAMWDRCEKQLPPDVIGVADLIK